jgi:hypothetical protein
MSTSTVIRRKDGRFIHLSGRWERDSVARFCARIGETEFSAAVYRRACEDSRSPVTTVDRWNVGPKTYIVDLQCQTHAGNAVGRRYRIYAGNEDAAYDYAVERARDDDAIAKVHGGDVVRCPHD